MTSVTQCRWLFVRAAALLCMLAPSVHAQPSARGEPFLTKRDLVGAAVVTAATFALFPVDEFLAERFHDHRIADSLAGKRGLHNVTEHLSNLNEYRAFYFSVGAWGLGRLTGKRTVADMGWHSAEAILGSRIVVDLIGGPAGRARPRVNRDPRDFGWWKGFTTVGYHSFPSRHTAGAFAWAAVMTEETRMRWPRATRWVAPTTYGVATAVGLGRMYTEHHWLTDVLAGAAIGTFAGRKAVRYSHAHPSNSLDRIMLGKAPVEDGSALRIGVRFGF